MTSPNENLPDAMASKTPNEVNAVATSTVVSDELPPQISTGLDVLSQLEFRSAASNADLFERRGEEEFSETPHTLMYGINVSTGINVSRRKFREPCIDT